MENIITLVIIISFHIPFQSNYQNNRSICFQKTDILNFRQAYGKLILYKNRKYGIEINKAFI